MPMPETSLTATPNWLRVAATRDPGRAFGWLVGPILICASVGLLVGLNNGLVRYYGQFGVRSVWWALIPVLGALVFSLLFVRVRYADFVPILRVSLRCSALGTLVYLVVEPPDFTLAFEAAAPAFEYVHKMYFAALPLAVIGLLRPSFIVPVAIYLISTRYLSEAISGYPISTLDIRYMMDMAIYLVLFAVPLVSLGGRAWHWFGSPVRQTELTFVAFGLHLGNYFWSGVAKVAIGPHLWTWVLENATYNGITYALENGTLPLGHLPWVVNALKSASQPIVAPLNLAVAGFQLFAIVCVFRISWLKIATVFYDLLHLGIYLLAGILFWPWIWNNLSILVALRGNTAPVAPTAKLACVVTILLGCPAIGLYHFAWLGWFDVSDVRRAYFEAVTTNSRVVAVPPSFFLSHSYSVSQGFMDTVPQNGHYAHTWWNSAPYSRLLSSGSCPQPPAKVGGGETEAQRSERLDRAGRFLRAHHAKMKDREARFGHLSYYLRSHHHPSNPYLFPEFGALKLDDIAGYNLVLESACLRIVHGKPEKTVVGRTVEYFDVR
jgi:hypothetical protein